MNRLLPSGGETIEASPNVPGTDRGLQRSAHHRVRMDAMTSTDSSGSDTRTPRLNCGCCGRSMPANRVTELGSTPGVQICTGCALWAARRSSHVPSVHRLVHEIGHLARWRP